MLKFYKNFVGSIIITQYKTIILLISNDQSFAKNHIYSGLNNIIAYDTDYCIITQNGKLTIFE